MSAPAAFKVRKRTTQQVTAASPAASVWVSANAGTGKTGVLVDRISRLLLAGVAPERILCLTFTKAAAAEMANRLSALLGTWSALLDDALAEELKALGEVPADADKIDRARRLFALTLEAPEGLRIRTIHSFCESLLGRFPLEARISPDFRVMDERGQRELQLEARDRVLSGTEASGTKLGEALRELAALVDEDRFSALMRELDRSRGKFRQALTRHGGAEKLIGAVYEALGIAPGLTEDDVIRAACDLDAPTAATLDRLCTAWEQGSNTNKTTAAAVRIWLALPIEKRVSGWRSDFVSAFLTEKLEIRSLSRLVSKDAKAADPEAPDIAQSIAEGLVQDIDTLKAVGAAKASTAMIRVGAALIEAYESIKAARGRLDYDDLIERASNLLGVPGGVSWVHFKLDGGIEHVLVDEAQDTSPDQWRVICEVSSDFFSGESRYEEIADRPRTVFAVGDEKQSIYSFQGAEPAMFGEMSECFAERAKAVGREWAGVGMAESFRSCPAVLDVVDKVFEREEAARGLGLGTGPLRHISARTGQAGQVTLWPKEEPAEEIGSGEPWDVPVDHESADSPANLVAQKIARTIKQWLDNGEMLPAQGRPIQEGDILILMQKRRRFAEMMVNELKNLDIPVSGRDRMILPEQLVIKDLIALGRLTLLPDDDYNTAVVLKGPLIGLSETQLFEIAHGRKGSLLAALAATEDTDPAYAAAQAQIAAWRRRADFMPPFEFYSRLLNAEGGARRLLARLGPEAADPIDDFLSAALDYERDHVPSMEGFLHWMETGATEVKRDLEQNRNEVRVMTVHGAKGLQAEIVFLADACTVPSPQNQDLIRWVGDGGVPVWPGFADNETALLQAIKEARREDALAEYRRLLYVALTRAKDRLYVTGFTTKRPTRETSWYDMVEAAMSEIGETSPASDGRSDIVYAKPQTETPDGGGPRPSGTDATVALEDWALSPAPAEPEPSHPLSPSKPADDDPPVRSPLDADDGARFKRGNVVHALMQTLPELAPEMRRDAAARYIGRPIHGFAAETQETLLDEVMAVLVDPVLAPVFGPGSRAEVPIAGTIETADGRRAVAGQIDRLVVADDHVLIVDYKTNRSPPDRAEDVSAIYLRQMATYRAALGGVFPGRTIRAVLLWTDGPKWMELPEYLLDAHAP